jgi:uncharacterized repeat protein (TIGR03803 family)
MNTKFDELARGLAQCVKRRQALKKFGVGLAGVVLTEMQHYMIDLKHSQNLASRRSAGCFRIPLLLPVLVAALCLVLPSQSAAQTFTTLHNFRWPVLPPYTNDSGSLPFLGMLSSNTVYGTTMGRGGSDGGGTVFAINTDGTGFTTLYSFSVLGGSHGLSTPQLSVSSGDTLYGTTHWGGTSRNGTVFAINTDGTGLTTLHEFTALSDGSSGTNEDGAVPGSLVLSSNVLYGMTGLGGQYGAGTVFAINTDGTGFSTLHAFTGQGDQSSGGSLIVFGHTLYGYSNPSYRYHGGGAVFSMNTDGTGFTNLCSFSEAPFGTNSDGAWPTSLILSSNTLYGTTLDGSSGAGTVFKLNTDGTGFSTMHTLSPNSIYSYGQTNSEGAIPYGLVLSGNTLYGFAEDGGTGANGTVFKLSTDGTGFLMLHSFTPTGSPYGAPNNDGAYPNALVLSGNTLYGTASYGGSFGYGTVFSISLPTTPPQLTLNRAAANVILTWPTNATGFTLQSTTDLFSPAWTTNLPPPVVVNGQNTVTNPISGGRQFFRLSR